MILELMKGWVSLQAAVLATAAVAVAVFEHAVLVTAARSFVFLA